MNRTSKALRSGLVALLLAIWLIGLAILPPRVAAAPAPQTAALAGASETGPFAAGAKVYRQRCASCHDSGVNRAPQKFVLQQMTPEAIHGAVTSGVMRVQAAGLSPEDTAMVAQFLANRTLGQTKAVTPVAPCRGARARFDPGEPPVFSGWGLDAVNTHSVSIAMAGIERNNVSRLKLKWAFGFEGATRARSQPALAGGAIFTGSSNGKVYAVDRETGCVRWTFDTAGEVRTTVLITPWQAGDRRARPLAMFGDSRANVYAVEAFTGKLVWQAKADVHPAATLTASPALYGGTLYVPISSSEEGSAGYPNYACCTFRGSVVALGAATGKEKWRSWLTGVPAQTGVTEAGVAKYGPSGVAVWNTPAIDAKRNQLTIGTGDNYTQPDTEYVDSVLALDLDTGRVKWRFQPVASDAWNAACVMRELSKNCPEGDGPDFDIGAGTVLAKDAAGREVLLAGAKSGIAYGIDPDTGRMLWETRLGHGGVVGGINFAMAAGDGRAFVPVSDMPDGRNYDIPSGAGVHALDLANGAKLWSAPSGDSCAGRENCDHGFGGSITVTPDLILAGADDAHLRIFDAASGKVLWDEDTYRDFATVNRVPAHGGSIGGGAAPIAYRGTLIVESGYGFAGKMPGNVLLVYRVK